MEPMRVDSNEERTATGGLFREKEYSDMHIRAHFLNNVNRPGKRVLIKRFDSKTDSRTVRKREKLGNFWRVQKAAPAAFQATGAAFHGMDSAEVAAEIIPKYSGLCKHVTPHGFPLSYLSLSREST